MIGADNLKSMTSQYFCELLFSYIPLFKRQGETELVLSFDKYPQHKDYFIDYFGENHYKLEHFINSKIKISLI